MSKNIIFFTSTIKGGGAEKQLYALFDILRKKLNVDIMLQKTNSIDNVESFVKKERSTLF